MKSNMMSTILAMAATAGMAAAHMEMIDPPPFRSKHNPNVQNVDYSMTSPLGVFPCKGYHTDLGTAEGASVATWAAGSSQKLTISGGAAHNGGSCQASLSYDKGTTFKVIHSYIGNCPLSGESSYPFTVPADAPDGEAIFAWTWFNQVGNREMYMNCAAVTISGGSGGDLSSLPDIFVANLPSVNGCTTTEGTDVIFPNPGSAVDTSSTNPAPPAGDCPAGNGGGGGDNGGDDGGDDDSTPPASTPDAIPTPTPTPTPTPAPSTPASSKPTASKLPGGVFLPKPSATTLATVTNSPTKAPAKTPTSSTAAATPTQTTPSTGTEKGAQTAGAACSDEGAWNCISGTSFQRCASGRWSVVMEMSAGTQCSPGITATLWAKRSVRGGSRFSAIKA